MTQGIPVVLNAFTPSKAGTQSNIIDLACSSVDVSSLTTWTTSSDKSSSRATAALACADGSLFVFSSPPEQTSIQLTSPPSSPPASKPTHVPGSSIHFRHSRPPSPSPLRASGGSSSTPRSISPTPSVSSAHTSSTNHTSHASHALGSSSGGFAPQRSRIVSGITREQASAPKNFVDFDEQPDKLKGLLKNSGVPQKTALDGLVPSFGGHDIQISKKGERREPKRMESTGLSAVNLRSTSWNGSGLRNEVGQEGGKESGRLRSAVASPAISVNSLSPPSSPHASATATVPEEEVLKMVLQYHVFLPEHGDGKRLMAMETFDKGRRMAVLQEHGTVSVLNLADGECTSSLSLSSSTSSSSLTWSHLLISCSPSTSGTHIITLGRPSPELTSESDAGLPFPETSLSLLSFRPSTSSPHSEELVHLRTWFVPAFSPESITLSSFDDTTLSITYLAPSGTLLRQHIHLPSPSFSENETGRDSASPTRNVKASSSMTHLHLPNPFRALAERSTESLSLLGRKADVSDKEIAPRDGIDEENDPRVDEPLVIGDIVPADLVLLGARLRRAESSIKGILWTASNLTVFDVSLDDPVRLSQSTVPMVGVKGVVWVDDEAVCVTNSTVQDVYALSSDGNLRFDKIHPSPAVFSSTCRPLSRASAISTSINADGQRVLMLHGLGGEEKIIWKAAHDPCKTEEENPVQTTFLLPVSMDCILTGSDDGFLRLSNLLSLLRAPSFVDAEGARADAPVAGSIVYLSVVQSIRTGEKVIVGGADDGSLVIWDHETLQLGARWTVFDCPLVRVIHVGEGPEETSSRLKDCIMGVARDGSVAVIALDGLLFQYVIPASAFPLASIHAAADRLVLVYEDGTARLWDVSVGEFRRSTGKEKVGEMIGGVVGLEWHVNEPEEEPSAVLKRMSSGDGSLDAASTVVLDVDSLIREILPPASGGKPAAPRAEEHVTPTSALDALRGVLGMLLTPALNAEIDAICETKLGIPRSRSYVGLSGERSTTLFADSKLGWTSSPEVSANLLTNIAMALRAWITLGHLSDDAQTVLLFYASSLPQAVGPSFQEPSLAALAKGWMSSSGEPVLHLDARRTADFLGMRQAEARLAIKVAFDAALARITDEEMMEIVERWRGWLPILRSDEEANSLQATTALFLCGHIAIAKYSLLSSSTLADIAKSISRSLDDDACPHRALSIDLCARGFDIWQHYTDATTLLRSLFILATSSRKEGISTQNFGTQARLAVIHVAGTATPLFMSTLALEILHPRDVQSRKSIMQLVAFLVRKKPLVIHSNLPRLVEAVVKSLDPSSTSDRDAVFDAATEILSQIVQTFPTVDFHSGSQRLAVGTGEGAVIMYDLKTATRLYVLEGHRHRLAACSFSPDGRRLVTASIEEGAALVWKVGSSISSFFNPGAPPRQGKGGGEPFKTFPFLVPDAGQLTLAATLEVIRFEWTSDRNVRLKIGDTTLAFSTG